MDDTVTMSGENNDMMTNDNVVLMEMPGENNDAMTNDNDVLMEMPGENNDVMTNDNVVLMEMPGENNDVITNDVLKEMTGENDDAMTNDNDVLKDSLGKNNEMMINDILKEMQQLNEVLKSRGAEISKLTLENENLRLENNKMLEKCEKYEADISQYGDIVKSSQNELSRNEELCDSMRREISDLREKCNVFERSILEKENSSSPTKSHEVDSDTSSIETTNDVALTNNLQQDFENKYSTLRCFAINLKKKYSETFSELEALKKKSSEEIDELSQKLAHVTTQAKLSQTLQRECDRLTDLVEEKENELKDFKKIIKAQQDPIQKLEKENGFLVSKVAEISSLLIECQKDKEALEISTKTLRKEVEEMRQEKKVFQLVCKEKEAELQTMKRKLDEEVNNGKKISDQLVKVQSKEKEKYAKEIASYQEQIKSYESKLNVVECTLKEKDDLLNEYSQGYERVRNKSEKYSNEASELKRKIAEMSESFENSKQTMNKQLNDLYAELKTARQAANKSQENYESINLEFQAYKKKASLALQKQNSENSSKDLEENLKKKIEALESLVKELKEKLSSTEREVELKNERVVLLEEQKEKLLKSHASLKETLQERNDELLSREQTFHTYRSQMENTLRDRQLAFESQLANYEKNISELEERLKESGDKLEELENRINRNSDDFVIPKQVCNCSVNVTNEYSPFNRHQKSRKTSLIPLEQLLMSDNSDDASQFPEEKMWSEAEVRNWLSSSESQVSRLTELLHETEKNSLLNERQVAFLKEEIRRLERCVLRAQHLEQSEYAKNIIFKFITMPSGDEKVQTVSVLETILKLSPEETETIKSIAKGVPSNSDWSGLFRWKS